MTHFRDIKAATDDRTGCMNTPTAPIGIGGLVLGSRERELVQEVLDSNRLSYGPMSRKFEKTVSQLHGRSYGVFCNSGTSALHLAITALKEVDHWNDGDEVIVPATTFISSANVLLYSGFRPVFSDVRPDTFNIDERQIAQKITRRTRAIMPVHLLGLPADMDPVLDLAAKHQLRVIEDSCESMFARYQGRPVGSMGDIGCMSTYVAHLITTGVGGMAITSDPVVEEIMRSLMNHGRDTRYVSIDDDNDLQDKQLWEVVQSRYRFNRIGFSYRLTELEAALGLGQLDQWEAKVERRAQIADYYRDVLEPFADRIQVQKIPQGHTHANMVFGIVSRDEEEAQRMTYYLETHKIETRPLFPLVSQPAYQSLGFARNDTPVADRLMRCGFYIGCHPYLTDAEVEYTAKTLQAYLR